MNTIAAIISPVVHTIKSVAKASNIIAMVLGQTKEHNINPMVVMTAIRETTMTNHNCKTQYPSSHRSIDLKQDFHGLQTSLQSFSSILSLTNKRPTNRNVSE